MVRLACERGTEEDFAEIEKNIERLIKLTELGDVSARADEAVHFFGLVARATHNETLALLVDSLDRVLSVVTHALSPRVLPELTKLRWSILERLRARDADGAEREMRSYLSLADRNVTQKAVRLRSTGVITRKVRTTQTGAKTQARTIK